MSYSKFNIILVETPMQLLNAVNYIVVHSLNDNVLIISTVSKSLSDKIIRLIADFSLSHYFKKQIIFNNYRTRFLYPFICILNRLYSKLLIRKYKDVNYLIIGNYVSVYQRYIGDRLNYNRFIIVDDGLVTYTINRIRNKEIKYGCTHYPSLPRIVRISYFPTRYRIPKKLFFFSLYSIKVTGEDELEKNTNEVTFHPQNGSTIIDGLNIADIIFLGQPLFENKHISKEQYVLMVNSIIKSNLNKNCCYIPHPREVIINEINCLKIKTEYPFEIYANHLKSSAVVISFYSSALINLKIMRPDLTVMYIYNEIIAHSLKFDIYKMFEDYGLEEYTSHFSYS